MDDRPYFELIENPNLRNEVRKVGAVCTSHFGTESDGPKYLLSTEYQIGSMYSQRTMTQKQQMLDTYSDSNHVRSILVATQGQQLFDTP